MVEWYVYLIPIVLVLFFLYMLKNYTVVPPHQAHVISGKGFNIYDGEGRYVFWPLTQTRSIMSKSVIEISVPKIQLHDKSYLPFAVEISCKVQIGDARKAAETLGVATPEHIRPIVDDTIQSASRSQAMQHELVTIMRERDTIESSIYQSTMDSLSRLGVRVTLFDIKNIVDVEGSTVIADMERVRSAELTRAAREAEATQTSAAEIVEAQKKAASEIERQDSFRASEEARLKQEQSIAEHKENLALKEMAIFDTETRRRAEIEKQKLEIEATANAEKFRLEAQGRADGRLIAAQADAEALRIEAEAEADAIRAKLGAEAEGTEKLANALKAFNDAGISVKIAEIYAEAQTRVSENVARGLQNNTKMFIPVGSNGLGDTLTSLIPSIAAMKESGMSLKDILSGSSVENGPKKAKKKA